jgi:LysM repeat protein
MSTTIDKIKQAMEQRKAAEASLQEENQFQTAQKTVSSQKNIFWIFLMQFMWVVIFGGLFYAYFEKDLKESFNKVNDKLDQLENQFEPVKDQLAKIAKAMSAGDQTVPQAVVANKPLQTKPSSLPRKIIKPALTVNQPIIGGASPATGSTPQPSAVPEEFPQPGVQYHTVERGETLYRIAKDYGVFLIS